MHRLFIKLISNSIGAEITERNILIPSCLFIQTLPINQAVASRNGKRFLTQKLHIQIANKPLSPQCRTEVQLLSPFGPTSFSLPSTFKEKEKEQLTDINLT
jgi:hypothetical protein